MSFKRLCLVSLALLPLATHAAALKTEEQRISYLVGQQIGEQLETEMVPLDRAALYRGLSDYLDRRPSLLTPEMKQQALVKFRAYKWEQEHDKKAELNLDTSRKFLATERKAPGIKVTRSGLQYRVLKQGNGRRPTFNDIVTAQYRVKTHLGKILTDSFSNKEPATIQVATTLAGVREALLMMPVGSRWQFNLPPELAYGKKGAEDKIEPNVALVYELELMSIR